MRVSKRYQINKMHTLILLVPDRRELFTVLNVFF